MKKSKERVGIIRLEETDRKILFELDKDARQPLSQIAKKLRLGRIVVDYRMKQLEKAGIIRSYVGFIDPYKFGLVSWKTYLKFQNLTKEKEIELTEYIKKVPNLWWVIRTTGSYDMMFCVLAENNFEYYQTLLDFQQRFNNLILEIATTNHINSRWYTRNYLSEEQGDFVGETFTKVPTKEKVDDTDIAILKSIAANCRIPIVDIANKLSTTARIVSYRIKELERRNIIVNYRLNIDVKRFGYSYYKVMLSLKDFEKKDLNALQEFFKNHPNIENSSQSYGPWNVEFELECEDHEQFNYIMQQLRETFPTIIKKYEYVQIVEELRSENNFLDYMKL